MAEEQETWGQSTELRSHATPTRGRPSPGALGSPLELQPESLATCLISHSHFPQEAALEPQAGLLFQCLL